MSATPHIHSMPPDLERHLGPEGATEYGQLAMMLEESQGRFAPMIVRSDLSHAGRQALLNRLAQDLGPMIPLRILEISREAWNPIPSVVEAASSLDGAGVVVLLGLEDTPGIIAVPGERPSRPPALAALNHGREALRRRCSCPMVVWCDDLTFVALREHAPDFLDHFAGLFRFRDLRPQASLPTEGVIAARDETSRVAESEPALGSEAALAFYERKLAETPEGSAERATLLVDFAESLWDLRHRNPTANLERARRAAEEAIEALHRAGNHLELARAQWVLGLVLRHTRTGDRVKNLHRAIAYYESALRVYTESDYPSEWARTQNNLGLAYEGLPTGDRGENLRRAIACYESALRVCTESDYPYVWAATQNNLGIAYRNLPTGDRAENLRRAIACYESALRVYTESDYPYVWAATQNNLGNAYAGLPTGDRAENLRRAIACYESALRVRTESDYPSDWATTQYNLGLALRQTGRFHESIQAFVGAAHAFRKTGEESKSERAKAEAERSLRERLSLSPSSA
jgi:tetratricopeptide (TPR) repeat protein